MKWRTTNQKLTRWQVVDIKLERSEEDDDGDDDNDANNDDCVTATATVTAIMEVRNKREEVTEQDKQKGCLETN